MNKLNLYLIGALILVSAFSYVQSCSKNRLQSKLANLEQNVKALNDTVRVTKTKNGELEFNRLTLIAEKSELQKLNRELAQQVENTKGKVVFIQGTKVVIHDTVEVPIFITPTDSGQVISGRLDTIYSPGNYRTIDYKINLLKNDTSAHFSEEIGLSVITGLKKNEKGDYEILFRTNFPSVRSVALEGAYIPRNQIKSDFSPRRTTLGLHIGYSPLSYDFNAGAFKLRNQITAGVGFNYRLIK